MNHSLFLWRIRLKREKVEKHKKEEEENWTRNVDGKKKGMKKEIWSRMKKEENIKKVKLTIVKN